MSLYYDDTDPDNAITATLRVYTGFSEANASFVDIASDISTGRFLESVTVNHTVLNDTIDGNGMYTIVIDTPVASPSLRFKAVELLWKRQISSAPLAARFDDVPTGHPYFQFIEALASSGITVGCQLNPPLYCPDRTLTRGEMAVYLAKALGLHWPH